MTRKAKAQTSAKTANKTRKKVLILYTGGTFGMDPQLRVPKLSPDELKKRFVGRVPELEDLAHCDVEVVFNVDSAHFGPSQWVELADRVREGWKTHDGVVVLHGTDTLAFSSSALSYLLRPCLKPVVITGAQKPLASIRTDARRNLISAVDIAAHGPRPALNQVTVFFDDRLFAGNRVRKRSALDFNAFESPMGAPLAVVGTSIRYSEVLRAQKGSLGTAKKSALKPQFNERVALIHLTPGFPARAVTEGLLPRIDGLVLVSYPSGTAPTHDPEFLHLLRAARLKRIPVVAVTEASAESPGEAARAPEYAASQVMMKAGCIWAGGMTLEAAFVKASWLLGQGVTAAQFEKLWNVNYSGETPDTA